MSRSAFSSTHRSCVVAITVMLSCGTASAVIFGDKGNKPIHDPGWPRGAAEVFNAKSRIAHWVGPPFGGGEWHAEYRGDTATLNALLDEFAKIDAPKKCVVVHDGIGRSFWLNMNNEPEKKKEAEADWIFTVWQPENWQQLRNLPPDFQPKSDEDSDLVPAPQIDIYIGGRIQWETVKIPRGIDVDDQRLEAHGFNRGDGTVLEGTVTDIADKSPLVARVRLEKVESKKGGYVYSTVMSTQADAAGHWVIKSAPAGRHRVVVAADGYADRVLDYAIFDDQPRWSQHNTALAKSATVSGRVTDDAGTPLAGVTVHLMHVVARGDVPYRTPSDLKDETDEQGRFEIEHAPVGEATVTTRKSGYTGPGLGTKIEIPAADVNVQMYRAAKVVVTVRFADANRPEGYIVHAVPEGGEAVGKWSGSGNISPAGAITFENIPPGKYVITGRPNPGSDSQETTPKTLELRGGETTEVSIDAK